MQSPKCTGQVLLAMYALAEACTSLYCHQPHGACIPVMLQCSPSLDLCKCHIWQQALHQLVCKVKKKHQSSHHGVIGSLAYNMQQTSLCLASKLPASI